jgi:hypothetical protein
MPIRGSPNGAAALVHTNHTPGRHGPESVDAINRNGGWTSCAGIGGRHQPVRACSAKLDVVLQPEQRLAPGDVSEVRRP